MKPCDFLGGFVVTLTTKGLLLGLVAALLLVTAEAFADAKQDTTATKPPNIIKGEVVKPGKMGKPTSILVGDTIVTASGLKYIEVRRGTGGSPREGQTVSVHYVITFKDGKHFESSRESNVPFEFTVGKNAVIKGWDEGVRSMSIGGIRKLIIPYQLAYGDKGDPRGIPPKTDLVLELELLGVK